ncbi:protein GFS12 [Pistacia vera]|uniref:protein GFS12 n=1 Tax=Pistacia vera TaxID=55513 RepID=UPI0012634DCE|nr:protein GFS12 [Pistacia vera]
MKMEEEERKQLCLECLHRRIKSDFSDQLIFSYGFSHSPLPFAFSAVVQMANSSGEPSSASQFILVYIPSHQGDCLTKYVDEYVLENRGVDDDLTTSQNLLSGRTHNLSDGGGNFSMDGVGYGTLICNHSRRFSCLRTITALFPVAQVGICSYSALEEFTFDFLSGNLEDHVLCSLSLLIEGKASGRDSVNFLNLIGIPSFDESSIPGCLRHPNISPVIGLIKTSGHINLVLPKTPYTLENILHFSPSALKSEWHIRFLMYQLLSAIAYLHGLGVAHGNICPSYVMLTESCWSWLCVYNKPLFGFNLSSREGRCTTSTSSIMGCCIEGCSSQGLYADLKLSPPMDWHTQFDRWWRGELSNFEYLLFLNKLAGRRWGDYTFHTVMPWVIDFSMKPEENSDSGWRDLSKSKWRLAKGDEQLDFTYSTSEIPHHVSDECLSELAVCSYKARRLPLSVLRTAVRSVYEPNEYPSTMQRLYQWTPDECIPEFFCDPQIFYSVHSGMTDLAVPSWVGSPKEFIKLHREALESHRVSSQIHNWIDITFGYKMSGQAAVAAKNVMLPSSEPTKPKSVGRRQLFTLPHPVRQTTTWKKLSSNGETARSRCQVNKVDNENSALFQVANLQELEDASAFSEHARHLSPLYYYHQDDSAMHISPEKGFSRDSVRGSFSSSFGVGNQHVVPSDINLDYLLEHIEAEDAASMEYQELLLWREKSSHSRTLSEDIAKDIFSIGCLLAELHLQRPLFDSTSLTIYLESGVFPGVLQELPPQTKILVEACIEKDWTRRPSAKSLLESPHFPTTVKSSYLFIAPLQLIAKDGSRLCYAANFAKQGALKAMGSFAAEMCVPYCLPLVVTPLSDTEAEWAYILLKEFIKCLTLKAVETMILPAIQKILQTTGYSHLKVSLLQDSFVREIWNRVGKQAYLETIHPLVISNLYFAPHKISASAASVLLIGSSEELGVPITVHQTILPLIQCFGRGICPDGIDVLVRIGGLLGEIFIVRQMLPLLKHVARSFINVSYTNKSEPIQSWGTLSLIDCLMTLDGLVAFLPREVVVKELIEDQSCLYVTVLLHTSLEITVLQVAATSLMTICQRIGPELTALHVLPRLKELFDELAFSQETANSSGSLGRSLKIPKTKVDGESQIESRMDLVLLLYPSFASLLGIEKLRQCCATWLLLEQFLLRCHNWKWENAGESSRIGSETIASKRPLMSSGSSSEYNPAKLLLNGVGWSIPQSQGSRSAKNLMPQRWVYDVHQRSVQRHEVTSNLMKLEPWFWFPNPVASWDGPDFVGRVGSLKDEFTWKIRASVISSVRAHHGALRSLAVCRDECTVFTAGIGPGFKGTVQKWELTRINCVLGYYGHEEVVNDICVLSSSGRIASCDGTVHVWNSQTGKLLSVFAEPSMDSAHLGSPLSPVSKINADQANMLNSNTLSSGILTSTFDGSLYTCLHHLESVERLVVGTGNGSLRFIDIAQGQKLHLWRGESTESGFPSLVSAICSCGSGTMQAGGAITSSSWIAAGLSSGQCRLFDVRSGNVIASWKAHDGYVTKLAAPKDHLLVSSSLDKTLRIWDLRRNWPSQPIVFKGHTDGISGFSAWGQDVISISKNKIGLSSLSKSADEDREYRILPHKLYMADHGTKNLSVLSSISILPFSRLFLVGTEDGYLRICC